MTKGALVGFDFLPGVWPSVNSLYLARPPTSPDKFCRLIPTKPPLSRLSLLWKSNPHNAAMQTLSGVMADGGAKVFEIAARPALIAALR
jgi:hypothetical protein